MIPDRLAELARYVGAGALFAALADLVIAEQYDREQAGRAVDEAPQGWEP